MQYWGITDRGVVRSQNQDSYHVQVLSDGRVLAVVCDGMGGARAGNIASTMTVECFFEAFSNFSGDDTHRMSQAAVLTNEKVFQRAITDDDCAGMGTTLVAALVGHNQSLILNVGDSRAYRINENGIQQITRDHSVVEDMVKSGQLTRDEARNHPRKNLITRALGCEPQLRADLFYENTVDGDWLLLCSDGLVDTVTDQEILFEVIHGADKQLCCQALVDIAKRRGAPDNVTCVLVEL